MIRISIAIFFLALSGCVVLSSSPVNSKIIKSVDKGDRVVTIISDTPYVAEISVAMAEYGFTVRPMSSQVQITEKSDSSESKFNAASARWGISLTRKFSMPCAFTDYAIYDFTMILTDIKNNEIVSVFKQKGSDGPCTTVTPVFGTLAAALSNSW